MAKHREWDPDREVFPHKDVADKELDPDFEVNDDEDELIDDDDSIGEGGFTDDEA